MKTAKEETKQPEAKQPEAKQPEAKEIAPATDAEKIAVLSLQKKILQGQAQITATEKQAEQTVKAINQHITKLAQVDMGELLKKMLDVRGLNQEEYGIDLGDDIKIVPIPKK